jgi:hypothetical protein
VAAGAFARTKLRSELGCPPNQVVFARCSAALVTARKGIDAFARGRRAGTSSKRGSVLLASAARSRRLAAVVAVMSAGSGPDSGEALESARTFGIELDRRVRLPRSTARLSWRICCTRATFRS